MRYLIALILFVCAACAQTPGTITRMPGTTTVTATAGALVCTFTNPAMPQIHVECANSGTMVLKEDVTPPVGPAQGFVGSFSLSGNSVTWIIAQPTAGTVTYQIAANGVSGSDKF